MRNNKKWLFALVLSLPILLFYCAHFFYHDKDRHPSGLIQWEHALYMISAKEYKTGDAVLLYQYPLDDNNKSPKIFFQPQTFILGYLWKWLDMDPGILLSIFGLIFTILTLRVAIEIIDILVTPIKYKPLIAMLFAWGGGILAICGLVLHFTFFKKTGTISDHLFFLDPGNGWWCLNFGRSLIYPFEAWYHFVFLFAILMVLRNKFLLASASMVLLTLSHPYSATELILIVFMWALVEFFYVRSAIIRKKDILLISAVLFFHVIYYGIILRQYEVSRIISKQVALDWGYKAWHFVPAYSLVWLLSFLSIKNIPLLQKHFSSFTARLFFCWGVVAFLLSVHGFAIKPVQPLHYTRGYVYAGFFLFGLPGIIYLLEQIDNSKRIIYKIVFGVCLLILLSDNLCWFYYNISGKNSGVVFSQDEQDLLHFFQQKKETGWVIGTEKRDDLTSCIQLYSSFKGWIPHPFLTFNIDSKRTALQHLITDQTIDERWTTTPAYFFMEKDDTSVARHSLTFPVIYENGSFKVFKIN